MGNGIDDSQYDQYDAPRPDDLYKRCEHGNIQKECATCEFEGDDE